MDRLTADQLGSIYMALGPWMFGAVLLVFWQWLTIRRMENRTWRTRLLVASSIAILGCIAGALVTISL